MIGFSLVLNDPVWTPQWKCLWTMNSDESSHVLFPTYNICLKAPRSPMMCPSLVHNDRG
jgi:hypothetical protein